MTLSNLTTVSIPDSVTSIGEAAFLEDESLPASVEYIYIYRTASACDRIVVDKGNKKYKKMIAASISYHGKLGSRILKFKKIK